jgi:hypothetical protein
MVVELYPFIKGKTMSKNCIIKSTDCDGSELYWSNEDGWVDKESATIFSEEELKTMNLPIGMKISIEICGE